MLSLSMAVLATPFKTQDPPAKSQQPAATALTNKDVVDMMKAGLTADVIVAKIKSSETNFDTSPGALAELKAASVPDSVMLVMVKGHATAAANAEPPVDGVVSVPDGTEIEIQLTNNASGEELKVGDRVLLLGSDAQLSSAEVLMTTPPAES